MAYTTRALVKNMSMGIMKMLTSEGVAAAAAALGSMV